MTARLPQVQASEPVVVQGSIDFSDYEKIKDSAQQLAAHIEAVSVTDENVKESRRLLTAVNKEVKKLEAQRIQIKKQMLEPYTIFEAQVKEIVQIVKAADEGVRMQVRELDEAERDRKKEAIKNLFHKRVQVYEFKNLFTAEHFLKPEHLNKSQSMNKIEAEMVNWFTKIEDDLAAIETMGHGAEILAEYQNTQSLALSVKRVQDRYDQLEKNKKVTYNEQKAATSPEKFGFAVFEEKDAKILETFMEVSQINYKKVELI